MELITKDKRPGSDLSIDVFYEETEGFSEYINDSSVYKMVLVYEGSFVVEENGEYRVVTAPVGMLLNERAKLKIESQTGVKTRTIFFKPSFIREEFTFEAINSGVFEKQTSGSIYQDYLLLKEFNRPGRDIAYYSLTVMEFHVINRLAISVKYDIVNQPDEYWVLRTRFFLISLLFEGTADGYINFRQYELFKDRFVAKVAMYMAMNLGEEITLTDLTKRFSVNKNALNEAFKKETSKSCMAYLEELRVSVATNYLQYNDMTISEVGNFCGYPDQNYFSKVFKKYTGMTPSEYQKQMRGLC